MELTPHIDRLRQELALAAEAGGDDARALAERLVSPLDSAARLMLLEALAAAAEEITRDLAPGSVEVRLRGRDPELVVTPPPDLGPVDDGREPETSGPASPTPSLTPSSDEGNTARLNLRLPDTLKSRIEDRARDEGLSLNAWLVRAAAAALDAGGRATPGRAHGAHGPQRLTGWAR